MSAEERRKVLQMVEDGRISAEQASSLMHALDQDDSADPAMEVIGAGASVGMEAGPSPEFDEVRARARRFAMIPLWSGIVIAILSAWGLYAIERSTGVSLWFLCLLLPLFLGVLLIALGAGGWNSKWLYVNVDRRNAPDWPRNITLGFPLPLGLSAWFLRHFGHSIPGMRHTSVDEIIEILDAAGQAGAPLIVNVDEAEGGERVQVYIG